MIDPYPPSAESVADCIIERSSSKMIYPKGSLFLRRDFFQKREFDKSDTMDCLLRLYQLFAGIPRNQ